jgi:hypothetical protein
MAIYKNKTFHRWARKQGLDDINLCAAVDEMTAGLIDADLGGGLLKKRIARSGQGKSGGFRTLVVTNKGDRWIFVYGFSKNERSNIDKNEEAALKKLAGDLLSATTTMIETMTRNNELTEVDCDEKEEIHHS